jgi:glucose-6-phosphate-specific signal transduction histidine kinase
MTAILALLTGPLGKYLIGAIAAVLIAAAALLWLHSHDNALRVRWVMEQQVEIDAAVARARVAGEVAVAEERAAADARLASLQSVRQEIAREPVSQACADSRAISDALGGLYGIGASGTGKAPGPTSPP